MFNYSGQPGLLGYQQPQYGGLLGTQNLMQQYLMNLYMRRYQPPAIQQQPGMVGSQLGQGGMAYQAPQLQQMAPPGKTEMQRMQEQLAAMQSQMNSGSNLGFDSGW